MCRFPIQDLPVHHLATLKVWAQDHQSMGDASINSQDSGFGTESLKGKLMAGSSVALDATDKQVVSIAKRYDLLREGEWWREVMGRLRDSGVTLVEADHLTAEGGARRGFDAAMVIQLEQMTLYGESEETKAGQEKVYVDGILEKKNSQIKAEWLKRKARMRPPSSGKPKIATLSDMKK